MGFKNLFFASMYNHLILLKILHQNFEHHLAFTVALHVHTRSVVTITCQLRSVPVTLKGAVVTSKCMATLRTQKKEYVIGSKVHLCMMDVNILFLALANDRFVGKNIITEETAI